MTDTQTDRSLEQVLIAKEREKWEEFGRTGKFPGRLLAEDFLSIGVTPTGGSRSRHTDERVAGAHDLPEEVTFDNFRVLLLTPSRDESSADAAIVTYRIRTEHPLYATSVWVRRDGRWQTVLYQATPADNRAAG